MNRSGEGCYSGDLLFSLLKGWVPPEPFRPSRHAAAVLRLDPRCVPFSWERGWKGDGVEVRVGRRNGGRTLNYPDCVASSLDATQADQSSSASFTATIHQSSQSAAERG